MKSDSFNIQITPEMLQSMLRGMIAHEHGDIVTEVITNHLDDYAVQQLYKAIHGISPKVNMHVGQTCLVPIIRVTGWKYLIDSQKDNIIQGHFISCIVTDVDPYRRYPITVEYQLYDTSGNLITESNSFVEDDLIVEKYD